MTSGPTPATGPQLGQTCLDLLVLLELKGVQVPSAKFTLFWGKKEREKNSPTYTVPWVGRGDT